MKSRRFSIVKVGLLFVVLLSALIFSGCGGGGSTTKTTTSGSTTTGTSTEGGLPDLIIAKAWMEEPVTSVAAGQKVTFHLLIKNIGSEKVQAGYYVLLGYDNGFSGGILAGAEKEWTVYWIAKTAGTNDIVWTVDFGKRITESNEDNNNSEVFTIEVK
jgi:subtilase family serine protease